MITINEQSFAYEEDLTIGRAFRMVHGQSRLEYLASLNGEMVLRSKWEDTPVPDDAKVLFIPIASGG